MRNIVLILVMAVVFPCIMARKVKTTRGKLQFAEEAVVGNADSTRIAEMMFPADSDFVLAGFDKPLTSLMETVFVTNRTGRDVATFYLTIEYFDRAGRQLHSRSLRADAAVPAGATRILKFPSWDRQKSFYYIQSRKPRTLATPFSVTCRVDSAEVSRK